jgi:hypothetical protein
MSVGSIQPMVLAIVFAYAGLGKLISSAWLAAARESALARAIPESRFALAYRAVGIAELVFAGLLLLPPAATWELLVAAAALLVFLGYLLVSRLKWGAQSCGCMGSTTKPGMRGPLLRLVVMFLAVGLGWEGADYWVHALRESPQLLVVALGELAAVVALSPEAMPAIPRPGRGNQHPKCATARVSLEESLRVLRSSPAFKQASGLLGANDPEDHWRDGCWRFLAFPADNHSPGALAVFAVPILKSRVPVRAAIVNGEGEQVLATPLAP